MNISEVRTLVEGASYEEKITILEDISERVGDCPEIGYLGSSVSNISMDENGKLEFQSEKNTNDETQNAPSTSILSADGEQCINLTVLSLYKGKYKINFGATLPNSTAESYVIYKVPLGASSFKLQILSNGFGNSSDYIVFSRDDIK